MKTLIIDSHKGSKDTVPQNMHWQNSKILADYLGSDLIWSYPGVNNDIKTGYDAIIFVHASHYAYTDYEWISKNPQAKLFYITNEYNLGEPRTLWLAAKDGRKYTVIANHPSEASKVVMKYVSDWRVVNLNSLIYEKKSPIIRHGLFQQERDGCVYYGSFRKDREFYFNKYLGQNVLLSTHPKNISKFRTAGATSGICGRISWDETGLFPFRLSLYIEDKKTHVYYNYLANRFYEAINYDCVPIFSEECKNTVNLSGYNIPEDYFISCQDEIKSKYHLCCLSEWHEMAAKEKEDTLLYIKNTILNI
jgi:hypothetical protein